MAIHKHTDDYAVIPEVEGVKRPGKEYKGDIRGSYPLETSQTHDPRDEATEEKIAQALGDAPRGFYCAAVPLNEAMAPDFPAGEYIIFDYTGQDNPPKDGDVVWAYIAVPDVLPGNVRTLCTVIRRYGVLPDGRSTLTPLRKGFASWTDGDMTPEGPIEIVAAAVATPYRALLHSRDEVLFRT